jgi:hypothetical protein
MLYDVLGLPVCYACWNIDLICFVETSAVGFALISLEKMRPISRGKNDVVGIAIKNRTVINATEYLVYDVIKI